MLKKLGMVPGIGRVCNRHSKSIVQTSVSGFDVTKWLQLVSPCVLDPCFLKSHHFYRLKIALWLSAVVQIAVNYIHALLNHCCDIIPETTTVCVAYSSYYILDDNNNCCMHTFLWAMGWATALFDNIKV